MRTSSQRGHFAIAFLTATILHVASGQEALAQVSDHAQCGTSLPACTTLRTNCCTRDFVSSTTQRAIIIPTDRCHQPVANVGSLGPPGGSNGNVNAPDWCSNPPSGNGNSMYMTYGLVYRLMQNGIPVYWIVNPTKAPTTVTSTQDVQTTKDIDFWVLSSAVSDAPTPNGSLTSAATPPVRLLTTDGSLNLLPVTGGYTRNEFPIRGGAFVIAPENRAAFETFWKKRRGVGNCGQTGVDCYDFRQVRLYDVDPTAVLAWQDFMQPQVNGRHPIYKSQLPVAMRVDYAPPRVARITAGNAMINWLSAANMNDPATNTLTCKTGATFIPADAISCDLDEADVLVDRLQNFNWAWFNISSNTCGPTAQKLRTFLTAVDQVYTAGNVMFSDSGITVAECAGYQMMGGTSGLALQSTGINETTSQPLIIRYPNNLFSQYGDLPMDFAQGAVGYWKRVSGTTSLYSSAFDLPPSTLKRLMTRENTSANNPTCANHDDTGVVGAASPANCDSTENATNADIDDAFAYARFENNPENGLVFYSPGQNLTQNNQAAQLKMVLSSLIATPPFTVEQVFTNTEVSRSQPVVATIGNTEAIVQGSYEYNYVTKNNIQYPVPRSIPGVYVRDDVATFTFPAQLGHMRAVSTGSIGTTGQSLSAGTVLFDAATNIPPVTYSGCSAPFLGDCRTVFTTTAGGRNPEIVHVNTQNVGTLGPVMLDSTFTTAEQTTFIQRILQGYDDGTGFRAALGGVDRSTVAVIGPGASVGGSRPTVAYFGATDGMLHAVCASVGGACTSLGRELWAFIPRTNLSTLRYNSARIDGSPRVLDVRGDFYGTGPTIRTVMIFQTGTGDASSTTAPPAVYALDITDPTAPRVLWEYATSTTRGASDLGVGLTIAAGEAVVGNVKKNLTFIQTNNGGTGGAGSVITAVDTETGSFVWRTAHLYPAPRVASNISVPSSGVPGGVTTIDKTETGSNAFLTDLVVADLYGRVWLLDPATGTSRHVVANVEKPLFSFSTDYHPIGAKPAIYSNGNELFAVVSSGGYVDTTGTTGWGTYAASHYMVAIGLNTDTTAVTLDENSPAADVPLKLTFGGGERAHAQARIVGDEIFVTTDTQNVNAANFGTASGNTGKVYRINLATGQQGTTVVVAQGASSVVNSGTTLFTSSGSKRQQVSTPAAGTIGNRVNPAVEQTKMTRKLWFRVE